MTLNPLIDISLRVGIRIRAKNFEDAEKIAKEIIYSIPESGLYSIRCALPYRLETIDEDNQNDRL